jgi:hypothetical protein
MDFGTSVALLFLRKWFHPTGARSIGVGTETRQCPRLTVSAVSLGPAIIHFLFLPRFIADWQRYICYAIFHIDRCAKSLWHTCFILRVSKLNKCSKAIHPQLGGSYLVAFEKFKNWQSFFMHFVRFFPHFDRLTYKTHSE